MNQVVNFFWTIVCFIPVLLFWIAHNHSAYCYIFISISAACLLVPARYIQLSNKPRFYESLSVKTIRRFVQNGDCSLSFIRKQRPGFRLIKDKLSARNYLKTIAMYERYHFMCFVFFLLSTIYAFLHESVGFAMALILANIIYNICPLFLQQYNKLRVLNIINH